MEDKVEKQVISDRTKQLIILSNKLQYNFYKNLLKPNKTFYLKVNKKMVCFSDLRIIT